MLGLIYSVYWFAASQVLRAGADKAAVALAEEGIDLRIGAVDTAGFPARFDLALRDVQIAQAGWGWQGAVLHVQADSYNPLAVQLAFPLEQTLVLGGQTLRVTSQDWRADAAVRPNARLSFDRGHVQMGQTIAVSDAGWQMGLAQMHAGLAHVAGTSASYDADLAAERIDLPLVLRDRIDPAGRLGPQVGSVSGNSRLTFARPLDRDLRGVLPDLDHLALHDLRLDWGPVAVAASGDIAIDSAGLPTGQITLRTGQWEILVDVLTSAGVIDTGVASTISRLAGFMADADGVLTVPVTFQDGVMLVALVPVGPAPRLR
ncbi:DUF2125 domain-containing protein [Yoonia sp.]|uniref:DUF2125 domain-containing protein n=1 Tax=Yoonia sp. TaxID=2212373 RepID=UPI00391A9D8F